MRHLKIISVKNCLIEDKKLFFISILIALRVEDRKINDVI